MGQVPMDLLQALMMSFWKVSRVNGMNFIILMTPALAIFLIKFNFFQIFEESSCFKFMDLYEPVKLFRAWNRDTGKSFETMKWFWRYYLAFQQDLVKICNCFQNFWIFLSFSEFENHYWPTKLFKSCIWITWHTSREKLVWTFSLRNLEAFLLNFASF